MKPRGIWMIIGLILVIGIGTTAYIRDYTTRSAFVQQNQAASVEETDRLTDQQTESQQDVSPAMARMLPEEAAQTENEGAGVQAETAPQPEHREMAVAAEAFANPAKDSQEAEKAEEEAPAMARAVFASQDLSADEKGNLETGSETRSSTVTSRLQELDQQIAISQEEQAGNTANSRKAASETERKLWESELSRFLDILEEKLDKEAKDALMKEQNEWIRKRESKALEASGKQSSSVMQELEYNTSMAESARSRVYELAQEYEELLSEAEK